MYAGHWSEIAKNCATTFGIVLGGGWAFWKWGYAEWQESKKNRASLDGQLDAKAEALANGRLIVTVLAQWNNRGQFPVKINPQRSQVLVYRLPDVLPLGAFEPATDFGDPLFIQYPFKELDGFELEPKTESFLRAHFVLEPTSKYFFRWELYKEDSPGADHEFVWTKELVWGAPSNVALTSSTPPPASSFAPRPPDQRCSYPA